VAVLLAEPQEVEMDGMRTGFDPRSTWRPEAAYER
jgi:hypothetical protein